MDNEPRMALDDDDMSLHSKLSGGGRDLGEDAGKGEMRLCPACGRVAMFVQDKCSNCDYKPGLSAGLDEAAALRYQYASASASGGATRALLIVLIVLVLGVIGYFVYNGVVKKGEPGTATEATPGTTAEATPDPGRAATAESGATPESHPGGLSVVTVDDAFLESFKEPLNKASEEFQLARKDCFVYRYRVADNIIPATSQTISITVYLGGENAGGCVAPPGNEILVTALQPIMDELKQKPGVTVSVSYMATEGEELADPKDVYLRYGKYYGLEHMEKLQPVMDYLDAELKTTGSYPDQISANVTSPPIKTHGSLAFISGGLGYLPLFETDAKDNIIMGTGSGLAAFKPRAVVGYYLTLYTLDETSGIDLYSSADYLYYKDNILPFPYEPNSPVHNMEFNPDGKPDGIACVVKNGKLLD